MKQLPKTNSAIGFAGVGKLAAFLCAVLISATVSAQTNVLTFQSGLEQTALLELYTSEGCSSCPPADHWLSGLKTSPRLWKDFVPVAFHVDYWDHLGWRDAYGNKAFSERQRAYSANWRSDNIYTPEYVLNGREWRDWSGRTDGPKSSGAKPGVLMVASSDTNHWRVVFIPPKAVNATYEVHAALLGSDLGSDVKAGENRGRQLKHDFVVRTLVQAPMARNGDGVSGEFDLPILAKPATANWAMAVWVTEAGQLEPLQATGGWLASPARR